MLATSSGTPGDDEHYLTWLVRGANRYEVGTLFEPEDLADFAAQPHNAHETITALLDYSNQNPFEGTAYRGAAGQVSHSFEDYLNYIFNSIEELTYDDTWSAAYNLCQAGIYGKMGKSSSLFDFGLKIFHRIITRPSSGWATLEQYPTEYAKLLAVVLALLPLVTQIENGDSKQVGHVKSVVHEYVCRGLLPHWVNMMRPWDQAQFREGFPLVGPSLLWTILYSDGFDKLSIDHHERSKNLAVQTWLSVLKENNIDLRGYLEEEQRIYRQLPYWLRTNVDWSYREKTGELNYTVSCEAPCEIVLDFDIYRRDGDPSLSVRLQDIDLKGMLAEVMKTMGKERSVPGEWEKS